MVNTRFVAPFVGALLLHVATASKPEALPSVTITAPGIAKPTITTITIPWIGESTTSTTLAKCSDAVTVVIETPIGGATCKDEPTSTTTPGVPTPTSKGACLIDPLCSALGLNVDYYANAFHGYSQGEGVLSNYYIVDSLKPLESSHTNTTYFPQTDLGRGPHVYPNASFPESPYYPGWIRATNGDITVDANNFTMVYSGFYRAPATGSFQLCGSADNENDIYFGDGNAFSCLTGQPGTAADPLVMAVGGSFNNPVSCATVELVQGLYYPIRSVMGNEQGPSAYNLTILPPGTAFEDRTNDFTGLAFPRECGIFL